MTSSLDRFLAERSGLTRAQIETANLHKMVERGEISAKTAANRRGRGGVSLGAYYRVLTQAKGNVEKAIYTLILSERLGYLRTDDFNRLLDLISGTSAQLDEASSEKVMSLVDALVRRIVM